MENIDQIELINQKQYRIIPSVYPTVNFFEKIVNPDEMEVLFEIESMTNERLREEVGDIFLISKEDRVVGPGSSVVMAAFTHVSKQTRFSDGSYGVYYAALTLETAIRETVYGRERFLRATNEGPCEVTMRAYEGTIQKPLQDIRNSIFNGLHEPNNYQESQVFGSKERNKKAWGLVYNSVRHAGGTCIAAFRPPAISIPHQVSHFRYCWNGAKIKSVIDANVVLRL